MSQTVFTFPGKLGDAIHQWPIAYHWAKQTGKKFAVWLDEKSCKPLKPLLEAQSYVESVEFKEGVKSYVCGGQPWHFDLEAKDLAGKAVYHLGLRHFPQRQLTLECLERSNVPVTVSSQVLASEPCFETAPGPKRNRLVLHGQPVYAHTKATPGFWYFLHSIRDELKSQFEEVVFIGDARDREVAARTYPEWATFDDGGDLKVLADYLAQSEAMIACGSSMAALAGALKVPCIRVHDPIGHHPAVIWSNLGDNQLNATELELRTSWPAWRDRWLKQVLDESAVSQVV